MTTNDQELRKLLERTKALLIENKIPEVQQAWGDFLSEYLFKSDPDTQIVYCNALLEQLGNSFVGYYYRGHAYMSLKNHEEALKDLLRANELKPNEANILYNIASNQLSLEKLEDANETCKKILDLDSDNPDYLKLTSEVKERMGLLEDALSLIQKAVDINPKNLSYQISLATCQGLIKNYTKALEIFNHVEKEIQKMIGQQDTMEKAFMLYFNRGQMRLAMGDEEGAEKDMQTFQILLSDLPNDLSGKLKD